MSNSADLGKCVGNVAAVEKKFTWCINNIGELCKLSQITSPVFKIKIDNVKTKWFLYLDDDSDDKEYLGLYLQSLNSQIIVATVNFYMLNAFSDKEINRRTLVNHDFEPETGCGFPDFIERKLLLEKTHEYTSVETGCCTIVCAITTNQFIEIESQKGKVREDEQLRLAEFCKLEKLFNKKTFSDVVFVVEGKEIHVHKCLVANRSPVFEAMFTHETSEAQNNRVEILDISYSAMHDMLRYIYTGRLPMYHRIEAKKCFMELLVAVEKYCIYNLKSMCEKRLSEFLKVDNVFDYLNFSDTHNASKLKEEVMEFTVEHGKEIVALPTFKKNCSELHADVVSEVFRALVIKKRKVE